MLTRIARHTQIIEDKNLLQFSSSPIPPKNGCTLKVMSGRAFAGSMYNKIRYSHQEYIRPRAANIPTGYGAQRIACVLLLIEMMGNDVFYRTCSRDRDI